MIAISVGSGLSRTQNALTVKTILGKTKCLSTQSTLNAARYVAEVYIYTKDIHLYNLLYTFGVRYLSSRFLAKMQTKILPRSIRNGFTCGSFGRSSFENQCKKLMILKLTFKASNSIEISSTVLEFSEKIASHPYFRK